MFVVAVSGVGQTPIEGVRGSQRSRRAPPPPSTPRPLLPAKNNRDASVTQFAVIDDENVSAMQQVTRGGGGDFTVKTINMPLASDIYCAVFTGIHSILFFLLLLRVYIFYYSHCCTF